MLSAQCDKLREGARLLRGHVEGMSTKELMARTMLDSASRMEGAANTIWELSRKLNDEQDENGRLRVRLADVPRCEACEAMDDCWECLRADASHKERRRLERENDRLRELVRDMSEWAYVSEYCDLEEQFADRMRELGVEVVDA